MTQYDVIPDYQTCTNLKRPPSGRGLITQYVTCADGLISINVKINLQFITS